MSDIGLVSKAAAFGMTYPAIASLIGMRILAATSQNTSLMERHLNKTLALAIGVLFHAGLVAALLLTAPSAIKFVIWVFSLLLVFDWRETAKNFKFLSKHFYYTSMYGLICFLIIVSFHHGANPGDNLIWSIYKLTSVTPGDSPQGLLQAQYLFYGDELKDIKDFSIFDRPFLGGLITLGALAPIAKMAGATFGNFSNSEAHFYVALWVWLNSSIAVVLTSLIRIYSSRTARPAAYFIAMTSPIVVFNIIGAWPKFFAVYVIFCASILILRNRQIFGVMLSGVSFLVHGSFLWAHLSLSGLLVIYLIFKNKSSLDYFATFGLACLAFAFPVLWFASEQFSGGNSPLRIYYMYGVPVNYGLYYSIEEIAKGFYSSTTPSNIFALPFVNLLKGILPFEIIQWISAYSYTRGDFSWRSLGSALFYLQTNRPLFAFGLTAGIISIIGIYRESSTRWRLAIALAAFFVLPMVPGMGLYRRDDHFILGIMLFATVPLTMALALGLRRISRSALAAIVVFVAIEYFLVFASRYPNLRFEGEFVEYYLWMTLPLLFGCAVIAIASVSPPIGKIKTAVHSYVSQARYPFISPKQCLVLSVVAVVSAGSIAPKTILWISSDGGFNKYGWNIDLTTWPDVSANRDSQRGVHTDLKTNEEGVEHRELWLNSGQSLVFSNVPATASTKFRVSARVHPEWKKDEPLERLLFQVTIGNNNVTVVEKAVMGPRPASGAWQLLEVELSPYSGNAVDIELRPISATKGVWTLWRDPIVVAN